MSSEPRENNLSSRPAVIGEDNRSYASVGEISGLYSFYSPSSNMKNGLLDFDNDQLENFESEDEDGGEVGNDETASLLHDQLSRLQRETEWNKSGIKALRSELGGDGGENQSKSITTGQKSMTDYEWSVFLHEWRRKFGDWGKRVLDVSQCEKKDRAKADHLLIEIYRRRCALASCKAHILNLLKAAGQHGPKTNGGVDDETK